MIDLEALTLLHEKCQASGRYEPFAYAAGKRDAKIMLIGEAWGQHEDTWETPFVWYAGIELAQMLSEAGITSEFTHPRIAGQAYETYMRNWWKNSDLLLTNVFAARPPDNNLDHWSCRKAEAGAGAQLPPLKQGKYLHELVLPHLHRLYAELEAVRPNIVIAMGNTACLAVLNITGISSIRGSVTWSDRFKLKVLPTYHPSAVLQNWSVRPITVADLMKAKTESEFPEIRRQHRYITINPTIEDIREWRRRPAERYGVDIETEMSQISMISFARSSSDSIVIPFINTDWSNYWPTFEDELRAWYEVKALLECDVSKIFQNGLFDLSYLYRMGFAPRNCDEDTMLLHHSLYPEMRKGLGFLGSIYANESAWKELGKRRGRKSLKREET